HGLLGAPHGEVVDIRVLVDAGVAVGGAHQHADPGVGGDFDTGHLGVPEGDAGNDGHRAFVAHRLLHGGLHQAAIVAHLFEQGRALQQQGEDVGEGAAGGLPGGGHGGAQHLGNFLVAEFSTVVIDADELGDQIHALEVAGGAAGLHHREDLVVDL